MLHLQSHAEWICYRDYVELPGCRLFAPDETTVAFASTRSCYTYKRAHPTWTVLFVYTCPDDTARCRVVSKREAMNAAVGRALMRDY
jgi:hypothetical protein